MKVSRPRPSALRITFISKEQLLGTTQTPHLFNRIRCPCNGESPLKAQCSNNRVQRGKQAASLGKEIYLSKIRGLLLVRQLSLAPGRAQWGRSTWLTRRAFPGVVPCAWQKASINYPNPSREENIKYVYQTVWPSSVRRGRWRCQM